MYRLYRHIFPQVKSELLIWKEKAMKIPNFELRKQALASIENKTFHCEGGSVYAACSMENKQSLISLIVAYQTISDYLDNLCDRSTTLNPENFAQLHQSMLDAVSLTPPSTDYYAYNDQKEDGGYLKELVDTCQRELKKLSGYEQVQHFVYQLASLYCDLQIHKHVAHTDREKRLITWWEHHKQLAPSLFWNEFAAATGSTLGIFHLFQVASYTESTADRLSAIMQAYFPWVCSLHILLDYLIDLEEDNLGGDLNFISYYENEQQVVQRMKWIIAQAKQQIHLLPDAKFHDMVIDGLIGLYLSDGKVLRQPSVQKVAKQLIQSSTYRTRFFFLNSRGYRGGKAVLQAPPSSCK
jgi:tetraprenyl-beta-curcumene synthase